MKWEFTRSAQGSPKYAICNADEGEPGTFKDRVLLTEMPDRVFAGLTIAGYAVGASEGIVYLRAEYAYLRKFLEHILEQRRRRAARPEDLRQGGVQLRHPHPDGRWRVHLRRRNRRSSNRAKGDAANRERARHSPRSAAISTARRS